MHIYILKNILETSFLLKINLETSIHKIDDTYTFTCFFNIYENLQMVL